MALMLAAGMTAAVNPYISKVFEYCPAPDQFMGEVPMLEPGMSADEVLDEVRLQLCGNEADGARPGLVSLGAFGGYVVFGFDHAVVNVEGEYDFKVYGNAFRNSAGADAPYGSAEPGIVMVAVDANGNGLPDDDWFELAGSEYSAAATFHDFEVTYFKPAADTDDIRWTSNDPEMPEGAVKRNQFHKQSYWPQWLTADRLTFRGKRLAQNARKLDNAEWAHYFLPWGYADNLPNDEDPGFKIDWAVDAGGNPVELDRIHFVKVYTGVLQDCGALGMTSTEISGAEDLHPEAVPNAIDRIEAVETECGGEHWFDLRGVRIGRPSAPGIYILRRGHEAVKVRL